MSNSKEVSLVTNSNSKTHLGQSNFTSKFCCTKSNSTDEANIDSKSNKTNILTQNDFKFIDEEITCNSKSNLSSTERSSNKILENIPKSYESSQKHFRNKKTETINEAQIRNKKEILPNTSASQSQILEETGSNKSTNTNKTNSDGFNDCMRVAQMQGHNENGSAARCEDDPGNLLEKANDNEREAPDKFQELLAKDERNAEKKTENLLQGGIARVIITNFKQTIEADTAPASDTAVISSVGKAQKDVNLDVNEMTLKSDLDALNNFESEKMCSGVTKPEESNSIVCLSDNKIQEGVSEVIYKKNIKSDNNMKDQKENLKASYNSGNCHGDYEKGDLANILLEDDDDPYNELQEYLEKIKREINEAFEQHQLRNDELLRCSSPDSTTSSNKLPSNERQFFSNDTGNSRKLNEICSSEENGKLTTANMSARSPSDYNQEKLKLENQLKCLIEQERHTEESNRKSSSSNVRDSGDVNVWANSILKELDNLMASDKHIVATAGQPESDGTRSEKTQTLNILRPEKHATIPLQSFNLNVQSTDSKSPTPKKTAIANNPKMTSLFPLKNSTTQEVAKESLSKHPLSTLKIEEGGKSNMDARSSPNGSLFTSKKENSQQNFPFLNEVGKKGSTSTIWTSEESILRSAGTVDEDNKSTSSSACEDTSTALSSGKSGNSLDSSENDNDSNEISSGTSKRVNKNGCWNSTNINSLENNNSSISNNLEICDSYPFRRSKPCTSANTVAEEPDLLEVLSLCGGVNYDDDIFNSNLSYFDTIDTKTSDIEDNEVVLRNKSKLEINENCPHATFISNDRTRKCRSHSIAESLFPQIQNDCEIYDKFPNKNSKPKRPIHLPFNQEPFRNGNSSNIRELPSPSSASLHSGHENMVIQELTTKSNSAPILLKKEKMNDVFSAHQNSLRYSRSQSDRYLAEIEAIEACKWLRAAGFPQYAQMYEDHQFPIDLSSVAKDHPLLDNDPLQSLYRRLCVLNRCATMRLDSARKHGQQQKDDSDDEGFALSENWMFQPQSRRWSRIGEMGLEIPTKQLQDKADCSSKDSSPERCEDDMNASANLAFSTLPLRSDTNSSECDAATNRLRRTGSERLKDGAKALLRRVESIKSRRRKRQNREGLIISGPQVLDLNNFAMRDVKPLNVAFSNPPSPTASSPVKMYPRSPLFGTELKIPTENENFLSPNRLSPKRIPTTPRTAHSTRASPLHFFAHQMPHLIEGKSDDSSSYCSDSQESNSGLVTVRRQTSRSRRFLQRTGKVDDIGIHSDSECHQPSGRKMVYKDNNSNNTEMKVKKLTRGGSLNLGKDSKKARGAFQSRSFRARSSIRKNLASSESDKEDSVKSKSPVVRWHSFREKDHAPELFKKCIGAKNESRLEGTSFVAMSCGQLQIIRKLALVTLTGYMERYCPTHRSGWNWELPKFIKKIKTPDYKDKKVFGVPFLLILQRTGYALPYATRAAFRWLRLNAFDQIGLFRKSGVKSRITKLKELIESSDVNCMDIYDTQQAYDVADMLKQYFRDLPDALLTSKMSETFVAIFQHLPPEVRAEAIQSAVLLLPDENREVLHSLLAFLYEIAANSQYNQMTANNLAVCWAPSLFSNNLALGRSSGVSPRRRKVAGVPDMKELSETRASHECLSFMIANFKQIFRASHEKMKHCNFSYMEESKPVPLEALGEGLPFQNWRGYLYECTSATIKEGREKTRGWVSVASLDQNVEIAFKKVGDGHPLRLWRCITEVEAPPIEVLDYILKERSSWDINLIKSRTVQKLDDRNEIFQYTCDGQTPTDYCVLRSWQSDLPKGACVVVETSVEHPSAPLKQGAVRGVVLASRFLIEPCGSGRSRVMHLARVDTKGRTPEFYNKCYGHICSHYLSKIRSVFRHITEGPESKQKDDSDDEGFALSENWMFQPQSRRWSRIGEMGLEIPTKQLQDKAECSSKDSSPERCEDDMNASANLAFSTLPLRSDTNSSECDAATNRLRRTGSERLKDGAKALLRRVESIKSRRRKRQNREGLIISGPQVLDLNNFAMRDVKPLNVAFSNPPSPTASSPVKMYPRSPLFGTELKIPTENENFLSPNRLSPKRIPTTPRTAHSTRASPLHFFAHQMPHLIEGKSDDSSSYCSDSQESNSGLVTVRRQTSRSRRFLQRTGKVDDIGIHSDSECHQPSGRKMVYKDNNSNNTEMKVKKLTRGGSLNLGKDSKKARGAFQSRSFRARSSIRKNLASSESDKEDSVKSKSPVVRWHSFREKDHAPELFKKCIGAKNESRLEGTSFVAMSCGQLQIIRKLALVTLTGYMERYCPTHRSGWNWELPKFIKKIKTPDYKDKKVFGVPFLLILQRTGYALPYATRAAFRWLRLNAFDQIGLFRKSGVKSRITKLKELIESSDVNCMDIYDTQQAYDVADMLKQYFRDLPDALLTSKMSETFVAIFQHLPPEVRAEAIQSAVLLLPDENREVLHSLLAFLYEIAANSQYNQMTANNLAVCWAPSLFSNNLALGRSSGVSPRRRKVAGVPDMKELSETRASHECLSFMIANFKQIFRASHEKMKHCNFSYMEESKPVPLEALGEGLPFQNWRGYLYECTSATIKEGREKTRGWVSVASLDQNVEIAFKKVGDGHPLRLWRCITEVEAPPIEVLDYILKERSSWDINLIKSRTVQKLDDRNEIFQYTCDGQTPTDYCVLRSWQSDLPKGACVVVETSVEHPSAPLKQGAVRGVVLASRFLIEPCGSGRSRVMHLARVDTKGRTPEFYNKCYGHICSHYLSKIRSVFRHITEGPESKV